MRAAGEPVVGVASGPLVISDSAPDALDVEQRVGGKAKGLGLLRGLGLPVPEFFVLTTAAFRSHLRSSGALAALGDLALAVADQPADPGALAEPAQALRAAIEGAPLADDAAEALARALEDLGGDRFAVRSSMVGEDAARHSFAGQLDSVLFARGFDGVADGVRRCWASAFSERALAYGANAGLAPAEVRVAVVVQRMVDADRSGVTFTANPVSGSRDECLVTAAHGVGEGVVAGLAAADEYRWSRAGGEIEATVREKDVRVVSAGDGAGTREEPVPPAERHSRVLAPAEVAEICELALRVADATGAPADVEWCYAGGRAYLLQARPITTLPPRPDPSAPVRLFDNSNIQESYNGVTTPLTFSFASRAYRSVFKQFARTLGTSEATLDEFDPAARTLISLVRGRVFYNLDSWYRFLELFPGGDKKRRDMEQVMWHTSIEGSPAKQRSLAQRVRRGAELGLVGAKLAGRFARLDAEIEEFVAHFDAVRDSVDRETLPQKSLTELYDTSQRLYDELLDRWETPNINDFRVLMACGRLRRLLEATHGDDAEVRLVDLLGGIDGIESVQPTKVLVDLARRIGDDPALVEAAHTDPPPAGLARLRELAPDVGRTLDEYVHLYGDRAIGELKLETVPLRDDPAFILHVLRNYLGEGRLDPAELTRSERERFTATFEDLKRRVPPWRRALLEREVGLARRAVKAREALRLRRTIAFGMARDIYRAMGLRLAESGVLAEPRDVMYVTVDELEAFVEGRAVSAELGPIAAARKEEFARHAARAVPDRFRAAGSPYLGALEPQPVEEAGGMRRDGVLTGLGCCSGVVQAPVRVILDPRDELSVNGRIICTVRTDPGWAPLFPTASGLIVERGSALSHSAVVAREFGIPTVVGVAGVTATLRDGETVRVDGQAGTVERIAAPALAT